MIASAASAALLLNPVALIEKEARAAMGRMASVQAEVAIGMRSAKEGFKATKRHRIFLRLPDYAQIQELNPDGSVMMDLVLTPSEELLADYRTFKVARVPRERKVSLKDLAVLKMPTLDPFVRSLLDLNGWEDYAEESFGKVPRWKANRVNGRWRLESQGGSPQSGQALITFDPQTRRVAEISIGRPDASFVWQLETKPLPPGRPFKVRDGLRKVTTLDDPQLPIADGKTMGVLNRLFAFFDRPRPLAVRISDTGEEPVTFLTDGFRLRQQGKGVDLAYSNGTLTVVKKGAAFRGPAGWTGVTNAAGDSGLRLDPTLGPVVFGQNTFRSLLMGARVEMDGEVETPQGRAALLSAKTQDAKISLAVHAGDGRILSISTLPTTGGSSLSSTRTFEYLEPSRASGKAFDLPVQSPSPLTRLKRLAAR